MPGKCEEKNNYDKLQTIVEGSKKIQKGTRDEYKWKSEMKKKKWKSNTFQLGCDAGMIYAEELKVLPGWVKSGKWKQKKNKTLPSVRALLVFFSRDFLFFSSDGFSKGFPLERNGWLIGTTMNGHEDGDDRCEQE